MSEACYSPSTDKSRCQLDLVVIGAGSAGFSAAITAAEKGAHVIIVGFGTIGGSCVNVGCVPSKTLIRAAETLHQSKSASRFSGITNGAKLTDWSQLVKQKDQLVSDLRQAKYSDLLSAYDNIEYRDGPAHFEGGELVVKDNILRPSKIIIATGSKTTIPPIPGIETVKYLTSTDALDLTTLPKSLLVIGGGYIGCELAQMLSRVGVKVTIVCRSTLLPKGEPEISKALTGYFRDEGITIKVGLSYERIAEQDGQVTLLAKDGCQKIEISADQLLLTTGRSPNLDSLNLDDVGVKLDNNGGIKVDQYMQSSVSNIFAAGDVTGRDQFVYMAAYGAKVAAKNALDGNEFKYDASVMPAVVFSDPQVATVGLTEAEARAQGLAIKTSILGLENIPRALAARDTRGLIKLIVDLETKKLLGAHIIAPEGADSIQTAAIAIKCSLTVDELAAMIFPYLTTVEGLKLAAQSFDKDINKLSCCAG